LDCKGAVVAEVRWVLVERFQGEMRRVTALDDELGVVTTHEHDDLGPDCEPDEFQLLCAVELSSHLATSAIASMEARRRRVRGPLDD
jgi:hypothetical protein